MALCYPSQYLSQGVCLAEEAKAETDTFNF